jgi:hypothetical protein
MRNDLGMLADDDDDDGVEKVQKLVVTAVSVSTDALIQSTFNQFGRPITDRRTVAYLLTIPNGSASL